MLNLNQIKAQFPILKRKIKGQDLVYLDNAATTQKPESMIQALVDYYQNINANVHRGIHTLSEEATEEYEKTRRAVATFINSKPEEVIFTRNTTESINLVAHTWGEENVKVGDVITVTTLEHHSNLVPWQELAKRTGATLHMLEQDDYKLPANTKLVAITAMSNVTGYQPDLKQIIKNARAIGALVLVDAAQSVGHQKTDVQALDCDFLVFSAHKMLGPTGLGVLYGRKNILEAMPPYQYGGGMIKIVEDLSSTWADIPGKFEAGTPNIADVIAFRPALELLNTIGFDAIQAHEKMLHDYVVKKFSTHPEVTLYTVPGSPVISFTFDCAHPHDIASIFNEEGVAIRAGHHCCQPLMRRLGVPATARISFYLYNSTEDIDRAEIALKKVIEIFK